MKHKLSIILLCAVLSFACSVEGLSLGATTATPTPSLPPTNTPTPVPTITPTVPTPTFTLTPTLVGYKSPTPTLENTATPHVESTLEAIFSIPNTATPTLSMEGFISVLVSANEIYKGRKCAPASVKFTAQVSDLARTKYVLLFLRFRGITSGNASEWTSISMETIGSGTYIHDLYSDEIKNEPFYVTAWIEYQFVATTSDATEIGRTAIAKEKLLMIPCSATPTPTAGTITP
jgi:hypothetical protein